MKPVRICLLVFLASALAACGGGSSATTDAGSATTTTAAAPAATSGTAAGTAAGTAPATGSPGVKTAAVPGAPTIGAVTAASNQLSVAFTPPSSAGSATVTSYTATCGAVAASGPASPLTVTGLTNATPYSCTVTATSSAGVGPASSSATGTPVSAVPSSLAMTYGAAAPFAKVMATSFAPSALVPASTLATRGRYLLSDAPVASSTANYLSIGSTYSAATGYAVQASTVPASSTYNTYLSKLHQLVVDATDASCYRMDSHLHPNNAVDVDTSAGNTLKFRNNFGKASVAYGYVCFSYDSGTRLLKAVKRYNYSTTTYAHTADASFALANYYVSLQNGVYTLVSSAANATPLYFYTSPIDFSIPSDFNPSATAYVTNVAAGFKTKSIVASVVEGPAGTSSKVSTAYKPQVTAAGTNSATKTAATAMLATIKAAVEAAGETLRYDTAVYTAFRDGLLAGTLQSDAISDGVPGQNLVPYVFFTNEKDSSGKYHPYMVIVSYGNGGNPHGLRDIARPPGDSSTGTGYAAQSVTRYTNLDAYTIGIPMKDYGLVTSVIQNGLTPTLLSDTGATPTAANADVYNYASTADNGIMISGAVMFPVYNNTLVPSQAMAELSAGGCHVGQGGGGPHCHADGYASSGVNGVYNDTDYVAQTHPPLIGFGYDGIALFGRYRSTDASLLGYSSALDAWGGHTHGTAGYHYHADNSVTKTVANGGAAYTIRSLIRGAYRGNTKTFPFALGSRTPGNVYLGGL